MLVKSSHSVVFNVHESTALFTFMRLGVQSAANPIHPRCEQCMYMPGYVNSKDFVYVSRPLSPEHIGGIWH